MYFDPADPDDLALLPAEQQTDGNLARVAIEVEADVLSAFTTTTDAYTGQVEFRFLWAAPETYGTQVALAGYDPNPALVDPGLAIALKTTVARVLAHRLQTGSRTYGAVSESRGERSVHYATTRDGFDPLWPAGWRRSLSPFSTAAHRV